MREFIELTTIETAENFIHDNKLAFLFISRPNCSVCHSLLPQVQALMANYPEIRPGDIDAADVTEVAGRVSIFTVPVLLLFVEGKEYIGDARIVHMQLLKVKIDKIYKNLTGQPSLPSHGISCLICHKYITRRHALNSDALPPQIVRKRVGHRKTPIIGGSDTVGNERKKQF